MNPFGISNHILQSILKTCKDFPNVKRVIIYGSRARGDYRKESDIDIAIDAPKMQNTEFSRLWNTLDDLPIIYSMDIVHLQTLQNKVLLDAIEKEGIVISQTTLLP